MFVEDVTIDGFKSYAQRVTVPGFDRHFNAITGLNGTGKSTTSWTPSVSCWGLRTYRRCGPAPGFGVQAGLGGRDEGDRVDHV